MRKEGAEKGREKSRQAASYGLLIALAMVFGYIESLLPLPVPVPGMKIGLANLVTIVCLEFVGIRGAVWVTLLRVVLTGLSFGNPYSMMYGLSGSFLSLAVMAAAKHYRLFSRTGISDASSNSVRAFFISASRFASSPTVTSPSSLASISSSLAPNA